MPVLVPFASHIIHKWFCKNGRQFLHVECGWWPYSTLLNTQNAGTYISYMVFLSSSEVQSHGMCDTNLGIGATCHSFGVPSSPFHSLVVLHTLRGCTVTYCNKESNFLPKAKPAFIPVHFLRWRKNFGGAIFSSWAVFFRRSHFFFSTAATLKGPNPAIRPH